MSNQTTDVFISIFKRLVAKREFPEKTYLDNSKTFTSSCKGVKKMNKSKALNHIFNINKIQCKFSLSRAPWWGGRFERQVGLVKYLFYKTVGKALLSWRELEKVLLDVENALNSRPLNYIEDDIEFPILTSNAVITGQNISLSDESPETKKDIQKIFSNTTCCGTGFISI